MLRVCGYCDFITKYLYPIKVKAPRHETRSNDSMRFGRRGQDCWMNFQYLGGAAPIGMDFTHDLDLSDQLVARQLLSFVAKPPATRESHQNSANQDAATDRSREGSRSKGHTHQPDNYREDDH
jgi:hypothetical protein